MSNSTFFKFDLQVLGQIVNYNLTASEQRIFCYLKIIDPFGDRYVDINFQVLLEQCGVSKSTYFRAKAKFQELGIFDFKDDKSSFRSLGIYQKSKSDKNGAFDISTDNSSLRDDNFDISTDNKVSGMRLAPLKNGSKSDFPAATDSSDSSDLIYTHLKRGSDEFSEKEISRSECDCNLDCTECREKSRNPKDLGKTYPWLIDGVVDGNFWEYLRDYLGGCDPYKGLGVVTDADVTGYLCRVERDLERLQRVRDLWESFLERERNLAERHEKPKPVLNKPKQTHPKSAQSGGFRDWHEECGYYLGKNYTLGKIGSRMAFIKAGNSPQETQERKSFFDTHYFGRLSEKERRYVHLDLEDFAGV